MRTNAGKDAIRRSIAGYTKSFAGAIAVGIGTDAESSASTRLTHEVARVAVDSVGLDLTASQVVYKGTLPTELDLTCSEVALFTTFKSAGAGAYDSASLFNASVNENWTLGTNAAYETVNQKVGFQTVTLRPVASATSTARLYAKKDYSGYSNNDVFNLAYNVGNGFTSAVNVRFGVDDTNYYTVGFTPVTSGYKISTTAKSAAVATGTPSWANIEYIEVRVTATAGGTAAVDFDSLRIEDTDTLDTSYAMVDRELVSPTKRKVAGRTTDVEYKVPITP